MPAVPQPHPASLTQIPGVGDEVHYVSRGSADGVFPSLCRAAKVTEVLQLEPDGFFQPGDMPRVGLAVINPTGFFFHSLDAGGVAYHPGVPLDIGHTRLCCGLDYQPGTWHWRTD